MKQLFSTNDITKIAFARAMLQGEGINCFEMDVNMSILEGSLGILPRRVMVRVQDFDRACQILLENGLSHDG